jgi:hypothetical protein
LSPKGEIIYTRRLNSGNYPDLDRNVGCGKRSLKLKALAIISVTLMAATAIYVAIDYSIPGDDHSVSNIQHGTTKATTWHMYDMFEEPFGEWWTERVNAYSADVLIHESYPYVYASLAGSAEDTYNYPSGLAGYYEIYAPYRLNITSTFVQNWNTTGDADSLLILPQRNASAGSYTGNISASFYWQYMNYTTWDDVYKDNSPWNTYYQIPFHDLPNPVVACDGWYGYGMGSIGFDRSAAVKWLDGPATGDLRTWYNGGGNDAAIEGDWNNYWVNTRGNGDWDVFAAYDWPLEMTGPYNVLNSTKSNADYLTVDFWFFGGAWDILLWRMLDVGNVSPYFQIGNTEDTYLNLTISPTHADVYYDAVTCYSLSAGKDPDSWTPCWMIESANTDYVSDTASGHSTWPSAYDPYSNTVNDQLNMPNYASGTSTFGDLVSYTYAPERWNLTDTDKVVIELPANTTDVPGFDLVGGVSFDQPSLYSMMFWGKMSYLWSDVDNQSEYYLNNRTIIVRGPAEPAVGYDDIYTNLIDGGYPTWYFGVAEASFFDVQWTTPGDKQTSVPCDLTVTAMTNKTGTVVTDYNGTVNFTSTIPGTTLPANYSFQNSGVGADNGVHTFTLTFNQAGSGKVNCSDILHSAWGDDIGGQVSVTVNLIPEFTSLLIPVIGIAAVFLLVRARKRREA